jgi:Tfp pilus assembly protein PilO
VTEAHWLLEQFTLGNLFTILSLAMSVGWQAHRLQAIERDLVKLQKQQVEDMRLIATTYERRDVMAVTLQGIQVQLHAIQQTLARLEQQR